MSVAEAIKRVSFATVVADFPAQGEGLLALSQGLVVVPEQGVNPANIVEGLRLAADSAPDLILLDMHMLDIGGIELVKTLRAATRTANVPVLMLTSNGQETATRAGFEAGATDYLIRPFSIPQLNARVRACFAHAGRG